MVGGVKGRENLIHFTGYRGTLYQQDCVNRSYLKEEKDHPQTLTFRAGLDFIRTNAGQDNWMVQIETFDPHEPFFSYAGAIRRCIRTNTRGRGSTGRTMRR